MSATTTGVTVPDVLAQDHIVQDVTIQDRAGVREIRLDRPAKRNALTRAMYRAMSAALSGAAAAGVRAIWLHGSAECFTAGNDIGDFAAARPGEASAALAFLDALVACETPIVASVNGAAVGVGTTMLLHCDLVYASAGARFQLPFVNLGICPEAGSSLLLPAVAGPRLAAELLLLGGPFDPATAMRAGLLNAILPDAAAADAMACEQAAALAAKAPDALRTARALLRRWPREAVQRAMAAEAAEFTRLLHGPEAQEAMRAFQEKRPADFAKFGQRAALGAAE